MCKRCGSTLSLNGYCNNFKCPYADWPQRVKFSDLITMSVEDIERQYKIKKRPQENDEQIISAMQNWDMEKKLILLEQFIESYGLERELKVYLQAEIDAENSNFKFRSYKI